MLVDILLADPTIRKVELALEVLLGVNRGTLSI